MWVSEIQKHTQGEEELQQHGVQTWGLHTTSLSTPDLSDDQKVK